MSASDTLWFGCLQFCTLTSKQSSDAQGLEQIVLERSPWELQRLHLEKRELWGEFNWHVQLPNEELMKRRQSQTFIRGAQLKDVRQALRVQQGTF